VQVKTTRAVEKSGRYRVRLQRALYDATAVANAHGRHRKAAYEAHEIDYFFIVTEPRQMYLIPLAAVAGVTYIVLDSKYAAFAVTY
jgi:hypothetical protein